MPKLFRRLLLNIGAMKSGTTWLYMMLKDHPEIECTPVKETHYFWDLYGDFRLLDQRGRLETLSYNLPRILSHTPSGKIQSVLDWFGHYFSDPIDDAWFAHLFANRDKPIYCADFSNLYSNLPLTSWDHVKSLAEAIRITYMMRSPIDRLWSHTRFQAQISGRLDSLDGWNESDFTDFLTKEGVSSRGRYAETITMLRNNFCSHEYLLCEYQDIKQKPAEMIRRIECFLGITEHTITASNLSMRHHVSPQINTPLSFHKAAIPIVEEELERLVAIGFATPSDWLDDLEEARARL